jgi:mRNA-degrading endonuclease RelE of RelBE toxin-antitoxin system
MLLDLSSDPKAVGEKKGGPLRWARAYNLRFRGDQWRAVYEIFETERVVRIWSFAKHDDAYDDAVRRR